ncbi:5-bromo-4-chloroindolyl phosphate hydrolysis family protein [Nitratiruptor tergarcus]|uniref:5-bromo-4-chloroindolyl phosphate hydrolysis protein n=1 Tax=Nitratiruptor tergarcus DSM 16512 TaxID=1069081 RepID=A0A1W1WSX8_9BACT|nr:5-bromo-4-chloroindolyl phosphate hydrolysis family protein [Nitratiruptor tergarcus]SMC09428.1 5-bromo-4-chloroindolyl phosphate hydrolysis protein [Nitratiruptor tergarcus DSM 16512]
MPLAKRYNRKLVKNTKTIGFLLYLFVIPPLIAIVAAVVMVDMKKFILNLLSFLLFFAALYLSKRGFAQEFAYNQATFAQAPKVPYKLLGALSLAVAVFYTSFVISNRTFLHSLFLALIAFAGYVLWYGLDPREDKIPDTKDVGYKVALQTINEAKEQLAAIEEQTAKIKNEDLRKRVNATIKKARKIIAEVEKKPYFVRELRKFLVVYINGLFEVTESYIKVQESLTQEKKQELYQLLEDVQKRFDKELRKIEKKGATELDIKMDTLNLQINE